MKPCPVHQPGDPACGETELCPRRLAGPQVSNRDQVETATFHVVDTEFNLPHSVDACDRHLLTLLHDGTTDQQWSGPFRVTRVTRQWDSGDMVYLPQCQMCLWAQERADLMEYQALSDYQRGAYDYLGQRGSTHSECMEGALSI